MFASARNRADANTIVRDVIMQHETILRMQGITKLFPGVIALDQVQLEVNQSEVHALMGENGAGKSTLIKILGGIYHADAGDIFISGEKANITSVADAEHLGISIIHQEISLVNSMTVADNIYLGREPKDALGLFDRKKMNQMTQVLLDRLNLDTITPDSMVGSLSIAQMQMIEIARALSKNPKIIIMDEPTSSLTESEVNSLFACIAQLKSENVAIIYVSHRMEEIFSMCDRITVFRDGKYVGTELIRETKREDIIRMMVGRELTEVYCAEKQYGSEVTLEVRNFKNRYLKNVSLQVRKGEVFGISGLVGARRTELARAIFGIDKLDAGEIFLDGKKLKIKNPEQAIRMGISLVPEDRKVQGLVLMQTIRFNMTIAVLDRFIKFIFNNKKGENRFVEENIKKLTIKTPSVDQTVKNLSGGNQQKVVIAKWMSTNPKVLILDEPTRGIDVGAKAEIYQLINQIAAQGVAVIIISSELPEVINMSSRIAIMHEGRLAKILDSKTDDISQDNIMLYATGGKDHE